jgi:lactate dehydrogenase-like 2-hydroxyacid dehydrogenase
MRKPVRVAAAYFVDAVETRLEQDFELRRKKNGAHFTPEELLSAADGADAMIVTPADRLDASFLNRVPSSVKVIATHSVGYDHIDLKAAAARKIAIAYIPGISTDAVADITLLLLLGASRRACPEGKLESIRPNGAVGLATHREDSRNLRNGTDRAGGCKTRSRFWDEDPLPRTVSLIRRG